MIDVGLDVGFLEFFLVVGYFGLNVVVLRLDIWKVSLILLNVSNDVGLNIVKKVEYICFIIEFLS